MTDAPGAARASTLRVVLVRWGVPVGSLAVSLIAVASELAWQGTAPFVIGAYAAAVLTSAALFARYRRPILTALVILAISLVYHLLGYPGQGPAFPLFVVAFTLPASGRLAWTLPAAVALGPVWSVIPSLPPSPATWFGPAVLGPALGMSTIAVIGAILAVSARQAAAEHAARTADAQARIARDIHDVLAHTIAAITVQSNLALDALDDDPELARNAVRRVRDLARAATPQLRHSLRQLRDDGRPEAPQPTLELIDQVLDDARAAGFAVRSSVAVAPDSLDPVVELTVARIVQEAVTNVVRHSGGHRLDCTVALRDGSVEVTVADDGTAPPAPEGYGIAGMHERAAAVGGTLEAAAAPDGFRVRASIPLPSSPEAGA